VSEVEIRFLREGEAPVLTRLVRETYGDTYDAEWVYQPQEIAARIKDGRLVSVVGELDGEIIGHVALSREEDDAPVMHSGVAIVTETARGQHLFTRLKKFAADWAHRQKIFGIFSEATAAHPYSQKANIDLGAHETGFLLGWIPASVSNNAALNTQEAAHRQSVALFYLKTNPAHKHSIFAPTRYQPIIKKITTTSGLRGELEAAPTNTSVSETTMFTTTHKDDHNLSIITVTKPGQHLVAAITGESTKLFAKLNRDAVYLDFVLSDPATEAVLDKHLDLLPFSFAGVFPNHHLDEDVLRLQALPKVEIRATDISTASEHGQELLDFVLTDRERKLTT
jgi:serine/threonine-protein kinase RsbW